jgi:TRAP-type C4-dicarboxylate transport system permease small subunit
MKEKILGILGIAGIIFSLLILIIIGFSMMELQFDRTTPRNDKITYSFYTGIVALLMLYIFSFCILEIINPIIEAKKQRKKLTASSEEDFNVKSEK